MSNVRGSEASYILAKWRCCKAHDPALASYQTCSGTTWPSPCHHHCEPIPSVTHSLVTATRRDSIQQQGSLLFGISGVCAVSMCTSSIASGAHTWTTPPYPHTTVIGRKATLLMVKSPSMWPLREAIRTSFRSVENIFRQHVKYLLVVFMLTNRRSVFQLTRYVLKIVFLVHCSAIDWPQQSKSASSSMYAMFIWNVKVLSSDHFIFTCSASMSSTISSK